MLGCTEFIANLQAISAELITNFNAGFIEIASVSSFLMILVGVIVGI